MTHQAQIRRFALLVITLALPCASTGAEDVVPAQGKTAQINGLQMYYEVCGEGEPLVLLHGFFGSGRFWDPLRSELAKEYQLVIPDLRNHGRSTNPSDTFTHRQAARDVYALLDSLNIRKFRAMGFSSGGMTLLHMATSQPDRVQSMVLFGATNYLPVAVRNHRDLTFDGFMANQQLASLKELHKRGDDQIRELIRLWHSFEDSFDDVNFTPPYLSTIRASTLIVQGDRDQYFPVPIAAEMYESIPDSYLWVVPNGGHVPDFEKPERYIGPLQEFLRGDWANNNAPR